MEGKDWACIDTSEEWERVDALVQGGHDGVIKELHWTHNDYVDPELNMVFGGLPNLWLLVQLQYVSVPSIEFLIEEVESLQMDAQNELVLNAKINDGSIKLELSQTGSSFIIGRKLLYKVPTPALLGKFEFQMLPTS